MDVLQYQLQYTTTQGTFLRNCVLQLVLTAGRAVVQLGSCRTWAPGLRLLVGPSPSIGDLLLVRWAGGPIGALFLVLRA